MRTGHFVVAVAGIAVGALIGSGLLYVNPLTLGSTAEVDRFDRVLRFDYPSDQLLMLTHAGTAPMPLVPEGVPELWESTIRSAATGLVVLTGSEAESAAVASKIVVPSNRTELLSTGVVFDDFWLLTIAGEGSFFVLGDSNLWPAIRDNVLPVSVLGRPWRGPRSYRTTRGPGLRGTAVIVGATGRFASTKGSAVERFELRDFSRSSGVESFAGELHVRLVDTDPPAQ